LGKLLYEGDKPYPVVGVVADFHEVLSRSYSACHHCACSDRKEVLPSSWQQKRKAGGNQKQMLAQVESNGKKYSRTDPFDLQVPK